MSLTKEDLINLGCDPEDIDDWVAYRKAKRKPFPTQRGIKTMITEAEKAGMTLAEAVKECAKREWVGFRAEYVAGRNRNAVRANIQNVYDVSREPRTDKERVRDNLRNIGNTDW